jgi:hypothetical protein
LKTEVLPGRRFFDTIPAYRYAATGTELFSFNFRVIFAFHHVASVQEWIRILNAII